MKTPIATDTFKTLAGKKLAIVPILRAGLGMVDGIIKMIPSAKVGHIGLYRDPETHHAPCIRNWIGAKVSSETTSLRLL